MQKSMKGALKGLEEMAKLSKLLENAITRSMTRTKTKQLTDALFSYSRRKRRKGRI